MMTIKQIPKKLIWERYAASWSAATQQARQKLFAQALDLNCQYSDPLNMTHGWDELNAVMQAFNDSMPGVFFQTTRFMTHQQCSVATWEMQDAHNRVLSDGISYAEYNACLLYTSPSPRDRG